MADCHHRTTVHHWRHGTTTPRSTYHARNRLVCEQPATGTSSTHLKTTTPTFWKPLSFQISKHTHTPIFAMREESLERWQEMGHMVRSRPPHERPVILLCQHHSFQCPPQGVDACARFAEHSTACAFASLGTSHCNSSTTATVLRMCVSISPATPMHTYFI